MNKKRLYINVIYGSYTDIVTFNSDYFYLVGDNLDNSVDSRSWGCLPRSQIVGKVILKL